jgi:hypothetical protein
MATGTLFERGLFTLLSTTPPLKALLGKRWFPVELPQAPKYPAGTYKVVSAPREYTHDGPAGLVRARIQLDLYATTYDGVRALKEALLAVLGGAQVDVEVPDTGSPATVVEIQGAFCLNESDGTESGLEDSGPKGIRRKRLDFAVTYVEK